MTEHTVVSKDLWLSARKTLLEKEKAFTKQRDELAAPTRGLPWTRVEKIIFLRVLMARNACQIYSPETDS